MREEMSERGPFLLDGTNIRKPMLQHRDVVRRLRSLFPHGRVESLHTVERKIWLITRKEARGFVSVLGKELISLAKYVWVGVSHMTQLRSRRELHASSKNCMREIPLPGLLWIVFLFRPLILTLRFGWRESSRQKRLLMRYRIVGADKAPGPNRFNFTVIQAAWDVVRRFLLYVVKNSTDEAD